jgi:hypothetical protein
MATRNTTTWSDLLWVLGGSLNDVFYYIEPNKLRLRSKCYVTQSQTASFTKRVGTSCRLGKLLSIWSVLCVMCVIDINIDISTS